MEDESRGPFVDFMLDNGAEHLVVTQPTGLLFKKDVIIVGATGIPPKEAILPTKKVGHRGNERSNMCLCIFQVAQFPYSKN